MRKLTKKQIANDLGNKRDYVNSIYGLNIVLYGGEVYFITKQEGITNMMLHNKMYNRVQDISREFMHWLWGLGTKKWLVDYIYDVIDSMISEEQNENERD